MQTISSVSGSSKMDKFDYKSGVSIDRLIDNIGPEESKNLLIKALPIIISRKIDILQALESNNMCYASECADLSVGSVRLYGSGRLESLLVELMALGDQQSPRLALRSELESEFDRTINEIQERLRAGLS